MTVYIYRNSSNYLSSISLNRYKLELTIPFTGKHWGIDPHVEKSIRSQGKLISYSGRLRNSRGFEILCQDSISSLSLVFKSSALCPHLHRTLGPRNKVSGNFICFWSVKMHLFPFTNYEMGSLFFWAYKHIIRKFVIFSSRLEMFTEDFRSLSSLAEVYTVSPK